MIDFEKVIKTANKSGRMFLGFKKAMKAAQSRKAVALIVASNCPQTSYTSSSTTPLSQTCRYIRIQVLVQI